MGEKDNEPEKNTNEQQRLISTIVACIISWENLVENGNHDCSLLSKRNERKQLNRQIES